MSRVDVIVPCYNYAHYLTECVASVLSQSHEDLRVLIVDDASPDHTEEVARELMRRDRRVKYRRHAANRGHIATYNEGLGWATGDYTALLSADDLLVPGALERACRLMDAHPEVGFVYGRTLWFESDAPLPPFRNVLDEGAWRVVPGGEWLETVCREGANPITSPEVVVRTRLQRELGGYRPELTHSGDMEMWLRFAAHADVGVLDADQAYYRIHARNMSLNYVKAMGPRLYQPALADYRQRLAAFDALFRDHGGRLADPDRLRDLANRGVAWDAFWCAHKAFGRGDAESCRQFLGFALVLFPGLSSRPEWSRLRWKRRFGPRFWSVLGPAVRRMRGRPRRDVGCLVN
jgi:glycosyltransferase involved in cell wall biosynthesis